MGTTGGGWPTVSRQVGVPPARVWAVLADGWLFGNWVVGSSRIRQVDAAWPASGAKIHHSFGVWPLVIDDETESLRCVPDQELTLRARGWPVGEATVRLRLEPAGPGATTVTMAEDVTAGPGRAVPRPARRPLVQVRNKEALRRLALLAEGGAAGSP